ncbi:MAG: primase-helicase family protein, partial [Aestuariivirga sp.]
LAGRFNGHLHDCCILFADEAFWPGDKAAEGTLKRIVTEDTLFIERKGIDGISMANRLKIIMASNEEWVVPAGVMERRFAVFDVSDAKAQSQEWFEPIYDELAHGGKEAMLFDLLRRDLGSWHPRKVIQTKALRDQQIRSLKPSDQWRLILLENGWLPGADSSAKNEAPSNGANDGGLFPHARKNVMGLKNVSDHVLGQILGSWKCSQRRWKNSRGWSFPPLGEMRAAWEQEYPDWEWDLTGLTEWEAPPM